MALPTTVANQLEKLENTQEIVNRIHPEAVLMLLLIEANRELELASEPRRNGRSSDTSKARRDLCIIAAMLRKLRSSRAGRCRCRKPGKFEAKPNPAINT